MFTKTFGSGFIQVLSRTQIRRVSQIRRASQIRSVSQIRPVSQIRAERLTISIYIDALKCISTIILGEMDCAVNMYKTLLVWDGFTQVLSPTQIRPVSRIRRAICIANPTCVTNPICIANPTCVTNPICIVNPNRESDVCHKSDLSNPICAARPTCVTNATCCNFVTCASRRIRSECEPMLTCKCNRMDERNKSTRHPTKYDAYMVKRIASFPTIEHLRILRVRTDLFRFKYVHDTV
jgi:hypothetical protein